MKEGQSQVLISLVLDEGHWQTKFWSKVMVGEHVTAHRAPSALQSDSCPSPQAGS